MLGYRVVDHNRFETLADRPAAVKEVGNDYGPPDAQRPTPNLGVSLAVAGQAVIVNCMREKIKPARIEYERDCYTAATLP